MDFILRKIDNKLNLNEPGSYDYITLLRVRIEYCLYLCLGYTWNNLEEVPQEKRNGFFTDLNNMSIGTAVGLIRALDNKKNKVITNKKVQELFDAYPSIRNTKIGHGYSMGDSIASALQPLYEELVNSIPFLREEYDIIIVRSYESKTETYHGIRLPFDKNGEGERWSCPGEIFDREEKNFPRTYVLYQDKYYKVSPFVFVDDKTLEPFVFSSLKEKLVGETKVCPLFTGIGSEDKSLIFQELICLSKIDGDRQFSQSNGTIMNNFQPNYSQYIDVGFLNLVRDFLDKNRAYVTATIWGHGGVGKTACIQKMCYDLFNDSRKKFSYIIFITAKDRIYNVKTGRIDSCKGNIRLYSEVIEAIARTVFASNDALVDDAEKLEEYERKISELKDRILIVIDDYETFEDCEKEKISRFLSSLDATYHKVIITTRNKRFVIGEAIPSNELDEEKTDKFIKGVVRDNYEDHYSGITKLLSDSETLKKIHEATSGRPIFIYQFIHLYVQKGYQEKFIQGIRTSEDAQEFLYGRIIKYLSPDAQYLFAVISVLTDEDMRFNINVLEHVLSKYIVEKDQFETGLEEIINQKVIERINDTYGRVYTPELLKLMETRFNQYPHEFKNTVKNRLDGIGGKDIKGGILEAMLGQADRSRTFGNEQETTEKYRRVLNDPKCPYLTRKNAIKHLADYLSNARLDPMSAIKAIEEYLPHFSGDTEIYILYIYLLWSQNKAEKEKAVNIFRDFFAVPGHKKTAQNNLILFSLGTGYCIDYDLQYRTYPDTRLKKAQYSKTFNEYGRELFDYLNRTESLKGKAGLFHNIRVALIQTIKLCYYISKLEKSTAKAEYALSICKWMRGNGLKEPFLSQINHWEGQLKRIVYGHVFKSGEAVPITPSPQVNSAADDEEELEGCLNENGQYSVGDIVNVTIEGIKNYGAFARLDSKVVGLIHISEIADRFIQNIYDEFEIGEVCQARIIDVGGPDKKMAFSTVNLR